MARTGESLVERSLDSRGVSPDRGLASLGHIPAERLGVVAA